MVNIGELPYGVLGTAPKFGLREEIEFVPCVYVLQTTSQKEIYGRVRTGCKEKLDVKNVLFFIYLLGLLPLPSPMPSSLLPGSIDVRKRLGIRTRF